MYFALVLRRLSSILIYFPGLSSVFLTMKLKLSERDFGAVIFDFDGTLVDSMWMWEDIDKEYLNRFDIDFSPRIQFDVEGLSIEETAVYFRDVLKVPQKPENMIKDWIDMTIGKYQKEVFYKPHAREFLEYLKSSGIKLGVATSNSIDLVSGCMDCLGTWNYIDAVTSVSEVKNSKPAPDVYLDVARKLSVHPRDCLVFEDVLKGVLAGKNAGMETCGVYDFFSALRQDELMKASDHYIKDFGELL